MDTSKRCSVSVKHRSIAATQDQQTVRACCLSFHFGCGLSAGQWPVKTVLLMRSYTGDDTWHPRSAKYPVIATCRFFIPYARTTWAYVWLHPSRLCKACFYRPLVSLFTGTHVRKGPRSRNRKDRGASSRYQLSGRQSHIASDQTRFYRTRSRQTDACLTAFTFCFPHWQCRDKKATSILNIFSLYDPAYAFPLFFQLLRGNPETAWQPTPNQQTSSARGTSAG